MNINIKQSMKNIDSYTHVRGESIYVDDVNVREKVHYLELFSIHQKRMV